MNTKQKIVLWIGIGIIDLVGAIFLHNRIVCEGPFGTYYNWEISDLLIFIILIAITVASLMFSLRDRPKRPQ